MDVGKTPPGSPDTSFSKAEEPQSAPESPSSPLPQPGLSEAGSPNWRPIGHYRAASVESDDSVIQVAPLPEQCPDWFIQHQTVFDSLQFFQREAFDTEQKKVDFLTGYKGTYNRVVYSLMDVEGAHQKRAYTAEQFATIHSWLETSLAECPLHWTDIKPPLNHLDQSWRPSGKGRNHFTQDKQGKRLQNQSGCFYPDWMQQMRIDQAILSYWNYRNEGVESSAENVKTVADLLREDKNLYRWLVEFRKATESVQPESEKLKFRAIETLLTESDNCVLKVENLSEEQRFRWRTLEPVEEMTETHYSLELDREAESDTESEVSSDEELPPPPAKMPKVEETYSEPDASYTADGQIEINRGILLALGRESEFESPGDDMQVPMNLRQLAKIVAEDLGRFSRRFSDKEEAIDWGNARVQCESLVALFDHLKHFCVQDSVAKETILQDCQALCEARASFAELTSSLNTPKHSEAASALKRKNKEIKGSMMRLQVKPESDQ
ncbi:MAG: hypothetical protein ACR2PT_02950 [Endozoicomonas sp.]